MSYASYASSIGVRVPGCRIGGPSFLSYHSAAQPGSETNKFFIQIKGLDIFKKI
jgi:hypothetical protein